MAQLPLQNSDPYSAMYLEGGWADKFDKFLAKFIHTWNPWEKKM